MMWRTQFERFDAQQHCRVHCCPGDRFHDDYVGHYDQDGTLGLECCGRTDCYAQIQSHADSCNIKLIIQRFDSGESDVLSRVQGVYADVLNMPQSYAEMLQLVRNAELEFDQLPLEVRQLFGCDFGAYMSAYGTEDFYRRLGTLQSDDHQSDNSDGGDQ